MSHTKKRPASGEYLFFKKYLSLIGYQISLIRNLAKLGGFLFKRRTNWLVLFSYLFGCSEVGRATWDYLRYLSECLIRSSNWLNCYYRSLHSIQNKQCYYNFNPRRLLNLLSNMLLSTRVMPSRAYNSSLINLSSASKLSTNTCVCKVEGPVIW